MIKKKWRNIVLYGITMCADITLVVGILTVSNLESSPAWWVAVVVSMLWIILFRVANWDRW